MTRRQTSAGLMALIAVLLHCVAFVYHSVAMATAGGTAGDSPAIVMCHGGDAIGALPLPARDDIRPPDCPVCSGAVAAFALIPPSTLLSFVENWTPVRFQVVGKELAQPAVTDHPPARGPPSAV